MLGKFSLASLGMTLGGGLTIMGIYAYAVNNSTLNLVGFFYGIPILLGGAALRAAQLKPVPFLHPTPDRVLELRKTQQTPTQKQIREEVTRFRYGVEAHLVEALERLKLSPNDASRPQLIALYEVEMDGKYGLVLRFDSPQFDRSVWQGLEDKMSRFFGPGIIAQVDEVTPQTIDVRLVTL